MIKINKDNFESVVLKAEGKVLVDFNADWCGPCRMLHPVLEELEEKGNYKIASINVDENPELSQQFGVMSIPCLVVFENGKEVNRSIGFKPKEEIESMLGE